MMNKGFQQIVNIVLFSLKLFLNHQENLKILAETSQFH